MKKAILILLSVISLSAKAQKRTTQFSIAAEAGVMATAQAYQAYNLGFGGSAKVLFPTGKKNYFTSTIEVIAFSGRAGNIADVLQVPGVVTNVNVATPSLTILPIKVGYKYFINKKFNAELEAGYTKAFVLKIKDDYPGSVGGYTFALGFGFLVTKKLDIGMRYELFESTASETNYTSFIGLRTLINLDL